MRPAGHSSLDERGKLSHGGDEGAEDGGLDVGVFGRGVTTAGIRLHVTCITTCQKGQPTPHPPAHMINIKICKSEVTQMV